VFNSQLLVLYREQGHTASSLIRTNGRTLDISKFITQCISTM